jgi:hypothetical protein
MQFKSTVLSGLALVCVLSPALAFSGSSAPDPKAMYQHRSDCHIAYDQLNAELDKSKEPSPEEVAWAKEHESLGNAGKPCAASPFALALRARDRVIANPYGAKAAQTYIDKIGDASAMFELGLAHYTQSFADSRRENGLALIRKAAEKGDPHAMFTYGMLLVQGAYGAADMKGGLASLDKAADAGHIDAMFRAGVFNREGVGTRRNDVRAFELFTRAASNGHAYAAVMAFTHIDEGRGTKRDMDRAYKLGRSLSAQGEIYGAVISASALLQSGDPAAHEAEILYWLDQAIARGDADIRSKLEPVRSKAVQLFAQRSAPRGYFPPARKVCPMKTTCTVNHYSGLQSCTRAKDYWSDCDG